MAPPPAVVQPHVTETFVRALHESSSEAGRLQRGAELVVAFVPGCDHAGVTVAATVPTDAMLASDDVVATGDRWQHELSEGPCLDAVHHRRNVLSQDLHVEVRWRTWRPRVVERLGIRSMLSLLLYTRDRTIGSLNLYGDRANVWNERQVVLARTLAAQLAVAAADARTIHSGTTSMLTRSVVGQAVGIVMVLADVDAERAYGHLLHVARINHRKLSVVAQRVVRTRQVPLAVIDLARASG